MSISGTLPFTNLVREFCCLQQINLDEDPISLTKAVGPFVKTDVRVRPIRLHVSPRDQSTLQDIYLPSLLKKLKRWIEFESTHLIKFQGLHLNSVEPQLAFITESHYGGVMDYIASDPKCNRLSLLQDALSGLDYLHRHHFVHGNIRGDNVFIKANGKCCLGEFAPTQKPTADQLVDTEAWLAPELFDSQRIRNALIDGWRDYSGEFTKASDTFSLGCLAVQLYTGEPPKPQRFPQGARSHHELWKLDRSASPEELAYIPSEIWPVVGTMLRYNPKNRRTTEQYLIAFRHPRPAVALNLLADVPPIFAKSQARRLMRSGI